jgi:fimbrial chaperone protein
MNLPRLTLALAGLLFSACAWAGAFSITPVRIEMQPGRRAASLEVENTGADPAQIQVERYAWQQTVDGEDQLQSTEEFIATPPIFSLAPGQKQIVRVLILAPPEPQREVAYRLILQETPLVEPAPNSVAVALRISLPVFITPASAQPDLDWRLVTDGSTTQLEVANRGTAHAFVSDLRADGRELKQVQGYVLGGRQRRWTIDAPVERLNYTIRDRGERSATVTRGARAP